MTPLEPDTGAWTPGEIGTAEHVGEPLTVAEIQSLEVGEYVVVTWSGGNGPHRYRVTRAGEWPVVMSESTFARLGLLPDSHAYESRLERLGLDLLEFTEQRIPLNRVTRDAPAGS